MELLTNEDIEGLHVSSCASFYWDQYERFEIHKENGNSRFSDHNCAKDGEGTMMWYNTQLEALISYNYYREKYKTVLLWDMAENPEPQHCVIIDKKFEV
jgi:hypothetical protein|tara:strand:+ start:313 stop:609 length:297 start_codon:yes stop_codon:yes gene_type:complete